MLSLNRVVREQAKHLAEQGDRTPSQQLQLNVDIEQRLTRDTPLLDRVTIALASKSQPHELWALSTITHLSVTNPRVVENLSAVTRLLNCGSQNMEFAAVCCCTELAKNCRERVAPQLVPAIVERMRVFPASEYVTCLEHCVPFVGESTVKNVLFPTCLEFLGMDRTFQYAGVELLLVLPFKAAGVTEDVLFDVVFSSEVVSSEYLPRVVTKAAEYLGHEWMFNFMPKRLVMQANSFQNMREGVVKAMLMFMDKVEETGE